MFAAEQGGGEGEAIGDGFAGAGLRGDEEVAGFGAGFEDGILHGGEFSVAAGDEGALEGGIGGEGHKKLEIRVFGVAVSARAGCAVGAAGRVRFGLRRAALL